MSHSSFTHTVLTGRLAEKVSVEIALGLVTVAVITGISVVRLDSPWRYLLPAAALVYSVVRIVLVARRNRRTDPH